jgi:hypothetical protein
MLRRGVGVLSISQPGKAPAQSECPVFIGFFAGFLEFRKMPQRRDVYMLWLPNDLIQLEVFEAVPILGHFATHN